MVQPGSNPRSGAPSGSLPAHAAAEGVAEIGDFARLIRLWRENCGLSLSAAARLAGITKAHLHDLEHGRSRNPCVSTLAGLARAYGGSVPYMAHLAAQALGDKAGGDPPCAPDVSDTGPGRP